MPLLRRLLADRRGAHHELRVGDVADQLCDRPHFRRGLERVEVFGDLLGGAVSTPLIIPNCALMAAVAGFCARAGEANANTANAVQMERRAHGGQLQVGTTFEHTANPGGVCRRRLGRAATPRAPPVVRRGDAVPASSLSTASARASTAPGALACPAMSCALGSVSGLAFDPPAGSGSARSTTSIRPRLAWLDIAVGPTLGGRRPGAHLPPRGAGRDPAGRARGARHGVARSCCLTAASRRPTRATSIAAACPASRWCSRIARDGGVTGRVRPRPHFTIAAGRSHARRAAQPRAREPDAHARRTAARAASSSRSRRTARCRAPPRRPRCGCWSSCPAGDTWTPGREWAYDLDPTPRQAGYGGPCTDGENGLSELYALDDHRLIALERACLRRHEGRAAGVQPGARCTWST